MKTKQTHPSSAEDLIRQEIERRGPMDFATFVDLALYHPTYGYYNQPSPRRGRAGDYFTSLQVGDIFPRIFADAILQMKETLGAEQFALIEVGAGNGEFLEGVLKSLAEKRAESKSSAGGFRVWAVERSRPARDLLYKKLSRFPRCEVVASMDDIDWMGTLEGCIFSNEFFDALPFERWRKNGKEWSDVRVDVKDGQLLEVGAEGHEVERRPQIPDIYKQWSAWLARGYVMTVDYGHPRESFLSPSRSNGTWMCYHKHRANKEILARIGDQDITSHVDFTQLVEEGKKAGFDPLLFCSQGVFLSYLGHRRLEAWLNEASEDEKRRRAAAVQQLIHPDAMGEIFWMLLQAKGVEMPPAFAQIPSRLRRLL